VSLIDSALAGLPNPAKALDLAIQQEQGSVLEPLTH